MKIIFSMLILLAAKLLYSNVYENGLGISSSLGTLSGGLGFNFEYQIAYKAKSRITPTIGGGLSGFWSPAFSIGIINETGHSNRFFSTINFGTWGTEVHNSYATLESEEHDEVLLVGMSVLCGYKRVFENGRMINIGGGISFPFNNKYFDTPVFPAFNAGYGFKFGRKKEKISTGKLPSPNSLPSKYSFLKDLDSVSFIVTDPIHLTSKLKDPDSANLLYSAIKGKVQERIKRYSLNNFNELSQQYNRQVTVAFNNSAYKNKGILDSLPYALWERCIDNKIRYFAVFYIYKTKEGADIERNEVKFIKVPFPSLNAISILNIPIYLTLDNVQMGFAIYDVRLNKLLAARTSNDDYYESPVALVEDLFQEMGLR